MGYHIQTYRELSNSFFSFDTIRPATTTPRCWPRKQYIQKARADNPLWPFVRSFNCYRVSYLQISDCRPVDRYP